MFYVYILKAVNSTHYYIGHTSDPNKRLIEHNSGLVKSTKKYIPWEVVYKEVCNSKSEAYKRELQIKSYKGGNAFKKLLPNVSG